MLTGGQMKYRSYTAEDFLTDESFVNYCLRTNSEDQTSKDILFWENLLISQPELVPKVRQAESLFFLLSLKVDPLEKQQELLKLQNAIEGEQSYQEDLQPGKRRLYSRTIWFSVAAAIVLCVAGYALMQRTQEQDLIPVYQQSSKYSMIKTGLSERKSITLSDGTKVLINGLTTLSIDKNYNKESRILWLTGEASFTVAQLKDKPFIVISGTTATTALGTSFKINNYKTDQPVSIMLSTGKVSVGTLVNQKVVSPIQLLPGEQVQVADDQFTKSTFDLKTLENWTNRKLIFSMASLKEIKAVLKEIYGVEINTRNQPKKPIAFTGEFTGESLTEVLRAIGFSNHFTYTIANDKVTLDFGRK